jgi:hypothetical protein
MELFPSPTDRFKNRMSGAFPGDLFGTASFDGAELVYEAVFEILIIRQAVHGGMGIPAGVDLITHTKGLDKGLRVFDSHEFLDYDLLF